MEVPSGSGTTIPIFVHQQTPGETSECDQHSNAIDYSYSVPNADNFNFLPIPNADGKIEVNLDIEGLVTDNKFMSGGSFGIWPEFTHSGNYYVPNVIYKKQTSTRVRTKVIIHEVVSPDPDMALDLNFYTGNTTDPSFPITCVLGGNSSAAAEACKTCLEDCSSAIGCSNAQKTQCKCHDSIQCSAAVPGNAGTFVVHTAWDEGVWWSHDEDKKSWTRFHPSISKELERLWDLSSKSTYETKCSEESCKCSSNDNTPKTADKASEEMTGYRNLELQEIDFESMEATHGSNRQTAPRKIMRMCGQTSKPRGFSHESPLIKDACVILEGKGTWLRAGTDCTDFNVPTEDTSTDAYDIAEQMILTNNEDTRNEQTLVLYGLNIVRNNAEEVTVELGLSDPVRPGSNIMLAQCTGIDNLQEDFKGLDNDGNCRSYNEDEPLKPEGCTVKCLLPPGNGKKVEIFLKRGGQYADEPLFTVNYADPKIDQVTYGAEVNNGADEPMEIATTGVSIVTIKGKNFGLNPSVSLQNVDVFGGRIYAQMIKDENGENQYFIIKIL